MGTWGTGIYQDDLTCEIREEYLNRLRVGMSIKRRQRTYLNIMMNFYAVMRITVYLLLH